MQGSDPYQNGYKDGYEDGKRAYERVRTVDRIRTIVRHFDRELLTEEEALLYVAEAIESARQDGLI